MNLYQKILNHIKNRGLAYTDRDVPFYACSIGCHMFNQYNKESMIYKEAGLPVDTRLHVLKVAPSGWGKSVILRQFLMRDVHAMLHDTTIPHAFELQMTEAGFVGTIKMNPEGEPIITDGLCKQQKDSIVGIEEFSALTQSMKQLHSTGLDTALLAALDDGMIRKRLAAGSFEYETNMTLWAGVQPARYNLSSGLGRRFCFIVFIPSTKDVVDFRMRRRSAKHVKVDQEELRSIKYQIDQKHNEMSQIKSVVYNKDVYDFFDSLNAPHFEELVYEKISLGYTLMNREQLEREIDVGMDTELKRILNMQSEFRYIAKYGANKAQVWELIKGLKTIKKSDLTKMLINYFSLSIEEIESILANYKIMGWIKDDGKGNWKIDKD